MRISPNNCNHDVCTLEAKLLCSLNAATSQRNFVVYSSWRHYVVARTLYAIPILIKEEIAYE